ncbi:hypothetical protein Tco_1377191 [Tanacetum coccineum]
MASLEFYDKHNMVAYFEKSKGSEGFYQIIDFLTASHINYALTENPTIYASLIEQFWQNAALSIIEDGVIGITATIDGKTRLLLKPPLEDISSLKILIVLALSLLQKFLINWLLWEPSIQTTSGSSPSKITSSPSLSPQTHPSTSQPGNIPPSIQTTPIAEEAAPMPHESPLQSVHSLGRDKGSLSLNALTFLCTSLSKKKLEHTIKTSQARRRAKVMLFDTKEDAEDHSKQVKSLIKELDLDAGISLVPPHAADEGRRREVSTDSGKVSIASRLVSTADVSTASELVSTAGVKAKDKGKAIMQEFEPLKKIKKRVQEARFKEEQEQERIDFETALELQKKLDEREEAVAKDN